MAAPNEESFGWTRSKLQDLVDMYKNRPCLYDNTSPDYHNREERARSWKQIADRMGHDEEDVRAKMKSIRTQYARIIQKGQHPKSRSGMSTSISSWWLLPNLSFLDDFITPRKAESETIKEPDLHEVTQVRDMSRIYRDDNSIENGDISDMMFDAGMTAEPEVTPPPIESVPDEIDETTVEPAPYVAAYPSRVSPVAAPPISHTRSSSSRLKFRRPLKKLKRDHIVSSSSSPGNAADTSNSLLLKTVLTFAERTNKEEDEDAIFGRYVGNEMRGVTDLQAKRIAKMRIQKVLFEAQTGWTETSNEGIYHAPRDGASPQETYPVGVVCGVNTNR